MPDVVNLAQSPTESTDYQPTKVKTSSRRFLAAGGRSQFAAIPSCRRPLPIRSEPILWSRGLVEARREQGHGGTSAPPPLPSARRPFPSSPCPALRLRRCASGLVEQRARPARLCPGGRRPALATSAPAPERRAGGDRRAAASSALWHPATAKVWFGFGLRLRNR